MIFSFHPNLISCTYPGASFVPLVPDIEFLDCRSYIIYEYVCADLHEHLVSRRQPSSLHTCAKLTRNLLDAIGTLHLNKLTHPNLHTANILCRDLETCELRIGGFACVVQEGSPISPAQPPTILNRSLWTRAPELFFRSDDDPKFVATCAGS